MNRPLVLAAAFVLSMFMAASGTVSAGGSSPGQKNGDQGQIKQTPKDAKEWHERDQKRREARKKAAQTRKKKVSEGGGQGSTR